MHTFDNIKIYQHSSFHFLANSPGEAAPGAARPSPSDRSTVRSVPGVPGATVRLDEEGFMDIREPMAEEAKMTSGACQNWITKVRCSMLQYDTIRLYIYIDSICIYIYR